MKKILALLIATAMLISVMPVVSFASDEVPTLDNLIGNELANGTFEAGIDGWTATYTTPSAEINNTNQYSAGAMKLTGEGTVSTTALLYPQEVYDVSVWAKPVGASASVTVVVDGKTVIDQEVTEATNLTGIVKLSGTTASGAKINASEKNISVTVDGDCYIDDVVVKEAEEKALNAVSTDDLGGWTIVDGNGDVSYDAEKGALKLTNSYNARAVHYLAVDKPGTYTVKAKVYLEETKATNKALKVYWSNKDATRTVAKNEVFETWKEFTWTIENSYPTEGDKAGIYFAIGGNGSSAASTFYIKDLSIKKVNSETVYAAPSITLTADKADTVAPVVTPTVESGDTAYYMYRYSEDGVVKETGFGATVPTYTVADGFEGTLSLDVTPVNSQGTYGETKTVNIVYEAALLVNLGVDDLDTVLNNKISKGTFENGMPEWTLVDIEMTEETENVAPGSFKAAKLTGNGTAKFNATVYENELYDANIFVKPVSGDVNVKLTAKIGTYEKVLFSEKISSGNFTKLTGQYSKFNTSYKNDREANEVELAFTLEADGDCYIDEFTLTPSENMLLSKNGIRELGSATVTEVGGWIVRGNVSVTEEADSVKVLNAYGAANNVAQYVVLDKDATYTLTAQVKAPADADDLSGMVYAGYTLSKPTFTLDSEWKTLTYTIDPSTLNIDDVASSIMFAGVSETKKADMEIKNASLVKVKKFTAPSVEVSIPENVVKGKNVDVDTVATFKNGDGVGYRYGYKLNDKLVLSGFATNDNIPSFKTTEMGTLTLTVIPVNSEGTYGAPKTATCVVSPNFVVENSTVSRDSLVKGATITMTASVKNNTDALENIAVIAAYYEAGKMINCDFVKKQIAAGQSAGYDLSVELPSSCNGYGDFKIFVWKGHDGSKFPMIPVTKFIDPVI